MGNIKIPYFIARPGRAGTTRYFWQPSSALRAQGWGSLRLADDEAQAMIEAQARNRELARWRAGEDGDTSYLVAAGTVAALIRDYKASRHYKKLRAKTRRGYDQNLKVIEEWAGATPVKAVTEKAIQTLYATMFERTPAKANAVVSMLRILIGRARLIYKPTDPGYRADNPAARPDLVHRAAKGRLWSAEAVAAIAEAADELGWHSIGTAIILNEWTGQREGDLIRLKRSIYKAGALAFTQSKTGQPVTLPVAMVPKLARRLDEEFARQAERDVTATTILVCETTGRPWTEDYFRHKFVDCRNKAAETAAAAGDNELPVEIAGLQFMHLRHTAVTRLFEAGVPEMGIAAITGHSLASIHQILDRYGVRTAKMAEDAFRMRLDGEDE